MELIDAAYNSAGKSQQQFAKNMETIEFKTKRLKNSWETLRQSFVNSDFFKGAADSANNLLQSLNELSGKDYAVLAASFLLFGKNLAMGIIKGFSQSITSINAAIGTTIEKISQKIIPEDLKIKMGLSSDSQQRIDKLKQDIENLKSQKVEIKVDTADASVEIEQLKNRISELNKKHQETFLLRNASEVAIKERISESINESYSGESYDTAKSYIKTGNLNLANLKENVNADEIRTFLEQEHLKIIKNNELLESIITEKDELEYKIKELENPQQNTKEIQKANKKNAKTDKKISKKEKKISKIESMMPEEETLIKERGNFYGQVFSSAFLTATTTGLLAKDPFKAFGTTSLTTLGLLVPQVVSIFTTMGVKSGLAFIKSAGPVALVITAITAAATAGVVAIRNKLKEVEEAGIENRIAAAKKRLEELEDTANTASTDAKEAKDSAKSMSDLKEEYEALNSKQVKTTEEQERYTELVSQIREQFPEIVTYYDETTGQLQVQAELWQSMVDSQKQIAESATKESYLKNVAAASESVNLSELQLESAQQKVDLLNRSIESGNLQDIMTEGNSLFNWQDIFDSLSLGSYADISAEEAQAIYDLLMGIENPDSKKYEGILVYVDKLQGELDSATDNLRRAKEAFENQQVAFLSSAIQGTRDESEAVSNFIAEQYKGNIEETEKITDKTLKKWSNLDRDTRAAVKMYGYTEETYDNDFENNKDTLIDTLNAIIPAYKVLNDAQAKTAELTDKQKQSISEFAQKVPELTATQLQAYQIAGINTEEFDKYKQQYIDALNSALSDASSFTTYGKDVFSTWTTDQISQFALSMANISDRLGEDTAKDFTDAALKFKDQYNLTAKEFSALMSTDFVNTDLTNIEEAKESIINVLEESMTSDEAKAAVEAFYNMAEDMGPLDLKVDTKGALKTIEDQVKGKLDDIVKSFSKTVQPAIENQLTNGFINFSDYSSLADELKTMKLDINDYVKATSNGYVLDTEALRDAYVNLALTQDQLVEAAKDQLRQAISEEQQKLTTLQLYQAQLNATSSQISLNNVIISQLQTMNLLQGKYVPASGIVNFNPADLSAEKKSVSDAISGSKKQIEDLNKLLNDESYLKNIGLMGESAAAEILSGYGDAQQKATEAQKKTADNAKKVADAQKKVADAEKKVADAQKDLQEALYGTEWYEPAIDHLYNYTTLIERLGKQADETKEKIENLKSEDNVDDLVKKYQDLIHQEAVATKAENAVIEQSVQNFLKVLDENYAGYYSMINDRVMIDIKALADAPMNDDLKSYAMETAQQINELLDQIDDNNDKLKDRLDEAEQIRKDARDKVIDLQDKVVEILKEKYQEEIDATKDKYSALEEADNDYLDALEEAIEKQRKLRDRENSYEDLAQKERKLALLKRDTSGANQKDVLSLEDEVQQDREKLLDDEVDSLIDSMKEMYETQKEARDAEIEYLEDVLDAADLYKEAAEIISNWASQEDMTSWFFENNPEVESMTVEKLEQYRDELEELYNAREVYMTTSTVDFTNALQTTQGEVEATISAISETLTDEADRSLGEVQEKVADAQEKAREALQDALDALADAQSSVADAMADTANTSMNYMKQVSDYYSSLLASMMANQASQTVIAMGAQGLTTAENEELKALQNKKTKTADDKKRIQELQNKGKTHSISQTAANPITGITGQSLTSAVSSIKSRIPEDTEWKNFVNSHKSSIGPDGKQRNLVFSTGTGETYYFSTRNEREEWYKRWKNTGRIKGLTKDSKGNFSARAMVRTGKHSFLPEDGFKYADGGLVNYTGPAWVDGTQNKPEAFLNAEDTKRIGQAAELLANLPIFNNTSNANNAVSATYGDTNVSVNITVESIANDYDVDRMMKRVEEKITSAAKPIGTSVILKK
nr:MAG TPA: chromosome segregation ATPase [Herelleviridae sp.]